MPRLFTGIEIPAEIRARLGLLGTPMPGARWTDPANMHVTLRFAGDIDRRTADEWAHLLAQISSEPFKLSITGLGAFGGQRPRLIWAGVDGGDALASLHQAHERAARAAGLEPETRHFKPHVTLARLRGVKDAAVARFLQTHGGLRSGPFMVDRVVLYSSRPGRGGGPYALEDVYELADPALAAYDNDN